MRPPLKTSSLPDGRRVAYRSFGDPRGRPVIFCHGYPGSSLDYAVVDPDAVAIRRGIHVVSMDRPGYGGSDPQPGRTLTDWPGDLKALADLLGIDTMGIIGFSGGGPYALAAAAAMPDRITGVVDIAGVGPPGSPGARTSIGTLYSTAPGPVGGALMRLMGLNAKVMPDWLAVRAASAALPAEDRAELNRRDVAAALMATYREAFRRGDAGGLSDARIYGEPWGFELSRVEGPVAVWHGGADRNVRPAVAEHVAEQLPDAGLHIIPGAGHLSINRELDHMLRAFV